MFRQSSTLKRFLVIAFLASVLVMGFLLATGRVKQAAIFDALNPIIPP